MPAQTPETALADNLPQAAMLRLPAELTIYTAAESRAAWLAWLAEDAAPSGAAPCLVDASGCDEIDAAGAQLLVALAHSLAQQGRSLQLQHASTPVRSACNDLGLATWLLADDRAQVQA